MQRLAQASRGEQPVVRILRRDQNNIEVSCQGPMLKAVVVQMKLCSEFRFGEASSLIAILPDDDRHLQLASNQKRFVAKLLRQARGIDQPDAPRPGSVPARQDIELDSRPPRPLS